MIDLPSVLVILFTSIFYGSILFLIAAGLQIVFGVQKILNLACGSFYALGAYTGITFIQIFTDLGFPPIFLILELLIAGLFLIFLGPVIERGVLRAIYKSDEAFQLLATFALVLIFEDVIKFIWGIYPKTAKITSLVYGEFSIAGATLPVYYLLVILISLLIAALIALMIKATKFGKILRATSDDREMAEALGVKASNVYVMSFSLGTVLGTIGGSLLVPVTAARLGMGVEVLVLAFAVVVIGGLGSMTGAFVGSMIVGITRGLALLIYPELETFVIYAVVIAVLLVKPAGLFGRVKE